MKYIGKVLLSSLLLGLLALVVIYVLLQSRWGAGWISRTISAYSDWQLQLSRMQHSFSSPSHLLLNDVSFGHKARPPVLVARQVDLGLDPIQFSRPLHFASIHLVQGALNISDKHVSLPLSAERLQLSEMAVDSSLFALPLKAERIEGAVMPWQPRAGNFIGDTASFQFSAGAINLAAINGQNLLLQGTLDKRQLTLSNVGVDLARGNLTGSAVRDAQGGWSVNHLRLSGLRLQTTKSLSDLFAPLLELPSVHIIRLDVTDARLQGPDWAVSDLNFLLKNLILRDHNWQSNDGLLSLNASSFVKGNLLLNDPVVNMNFSPSGIELTQFSSRWMNGLVRASGNWQRARKMLTLDDFAFAGLEYTLPLKWRELWMKPLPAWLDSVAVTRFSASRNLIIDINPDFPFQMTSLEGSGSNLLLAEDHQWGIRGGIINFNAAEATFNRADLRYPSITITANNSQINVTEMSAFAQQGMLEAKATVSQTPDHRLTLCMKGRNVPVNELQNWGWPMLPLSGDGDLHLDLNASLTAGAPLQQNVNGTLNVTQNNKTLSQSMVNGVVSRG